jgi:hypothetical protein
MAEEPTVPTPLVAIDLVSLSEDEPSVWSNGSCVRENDVWDWSPARRPGLVLHPIAAEPGAI